MAIPVQDFVDLLADRHRVVVIGGLAVIAHGYSRHTQDADVWLDPMESPEVWAKELELTAGQIAGCSLHRLPGWVEVCGEEVAIAAEDVGMLRVLGLSCPLDVFRRPNEFDESDFERVVSRANRSGDGTLLPDPLDLIQSKLDTGRDKDLRDIQHLESVVRADYKRRLPEAALSEVVEMLDRYSDWEVLQVALENREPEVRELAMKHLREFAEAGDPFSLAILEGRDIP